MILNSSQHRALSWPVPGTIVSIPILVLFRHKGIVSDRLYNGKPTVISNSARAGGVCEEPWDTFAAGCIVTPEGYPSALPGHEVVQRARSVIGTPYRLLDWNCDYVVAFAHGLKLGSPQVAATLAVLALGGLLVGK